VQAVGELPGDRLAHMLDLEKVDDLLNLAPLSISSRGAPPSQ
jgi:hypothetical protein